MSLKQQVAYVIGLTVLLIVGTVFLGNQRFAHADQANGENINEGVYAELCANGLVQFCNGSGDEDTDVTPPPVDPCYDIFPGIPNMPECDSSGGGDEGGGGGGGNPDVCPDVDGVQTSTDECQPSGGGGGGALPACSDTLDNDNDGQTDLNDDDCSDAQDNDEADPAPTTGGGGGGGGGGGYQSSATTTGTVLGATTTSALPDVACDAYLTSFIKPGGNNDPEQVTRLQLVLKMFEGQDVEATGAYDAPTISAVHAFQTKYASDILAPWGITKSTGFVYLTTRKKINEVYCDRGMTFPLTEEEQNLISSANKGPRTETRAAAPATTVVEQAAKVEPKTIVVTEPESRTIPEESAVESPWTRVSDFFKRILDRVR